MKRFTKALSLLLAVVMMLLVAEPAFAAIKDVYKTTTLAAGKTVSGKQSDSDYDSGIRTNYIYKITTKSDGYITVTEQGYIYLTAKGREIAETMYERHKLISSWLVSLGVDEKTATEDACKLEHHISSESFEALKRHIHHT